MEIEAINISFSVKLCEFRSVTFVSRIWIWFDQFDLVWETSRKVCTWLPIRFGMLRFKNGNKLMQLVVKFEFIADINIAWMHQQLCEKDKKRMRCWFTLHMHVHSHLLSFACGSTLNFAYFKMTYWDYVWKNLKSFPYALQKFFDEILIEKHI